jgi:hypothetical protein
MISTNISPSRPSKPPSQPIKQAIADLLALLVERDPDPVVVRFLELEWL